MTRWRRRRPRRELPEAVADLERARGERVLAAERVDGGGPWLLATTYDLVEVAPDGEIRSRRPWHEVDAAMWNRDTGALTVTWVDGSDSPPWPLAGDPTFLSVLRERVQASVVLSEDVTLPGRRRARLVLRQDLSSGRLVEQVLLRAGTTVDASARPALDAALARLRTEAGLSPDPP